VRDFPGGFTDFQENRSIGTELTLKVGALKA